MPRTKRKPNQNQLKKAASVAGAVGASMALAGGAYATGDANSSPDVSARDTTLGPQINLSEEELSDVSLGTFYVFDKEDLSMAGAEFAARCGRCGRCGGAGRCGGRCAAVARCARCGGCRGCAVGGCRACRACGGCSGCSCGCCVSWGACRFTC
jgi:hypothetical protein